MGTHGPWVSAHHQHPYVSPAPSDQQPPENIFPHQSLRATQATPTRRSIRPSPHHSSRKLPHSAKNRSLLIELRLDHQQTFFADRATSRFQKHKIAAESQLRPAVFILLPSLLSILHFSGPAIDIKKNNLAVESSSRTSIFFGAYDTDQFGDISAADK